MSADNRICIMQHWSGEWAVWNGSGSDDYYEPPCHSNFFDTEGEAENYARREADRISYLEYGIQHISADEQKTGLRYALKDLSDRLVRLSRTGSQFRRRDGEVDDRQDVLVGREPRLYSAIELVELLRLADATPEQILEAREDIGGCASGWRFVNKDENDCHGRERSVSTLPNVLLPVVEALQERGQLSNDGFYIIQ